MRKYLVLLVLIVFLIGSAYGQSVSEDKKLVLQGGLGISPLEGIVGNTKGVPFSMSLSYKISEEISIGIYTGLHTTKWVAMEAVPGWFEESGYNYTYISIGGRGLYHVDFFENENIDTYGVVSLGYCIVSWSGFGLVTEEEAKTSFIMYGFGGGIRYFFTPNIGVFGESGYGAGIDLLALGISLKL